MYFATEFRHMRRVSVTASWEKKINTLSIIISEKKPLLLETIGVTRMTGKSLVEQEDEKRLVVFNLKSEDILLRR
jgi:hypothetical protein